MADLYSALGIIAFTAAMLGLIWALDRVWVFLKSSSWPSPPWCSCTSATPCSSRRNS